MKYLIVLFILISGFAFGDNIADFNFSMEIGYFPFNNWSINHLVYANKGLDFNCIFTGEIEVLNTFFIGGTIGTSMSIKNSDLSFIPSDVFYSFTAGIRIYNFEFGFRHNCYHPIYIYLEMSGLQGMTDVFAEGAFEEFYFKFKGSVELF